MKTKLFKRVLPSLLLIVAMLVALAPMSALAAMEGNKVTSTEFTMRGYGYGKSVASCRAVGAKTGAASETYIASQEIVEVPAGDNESIDQMTVSSDQYLRAGKQYYLKIVYAAHPDDSAGFADSFDPEGVPLKVNGTECLPFDTEPEAVRISPDKSENGYCAYYRLPELEAIPVVIPFSKIVEKGGDVVPGTESFELEVHNSVIGSNTPISNYRIDGLSFTTEGIETVQKQFTITHDDFGAILDLLDEGILVTEKQGWNAGWQYDDAVWCVKRYHPPAVNALDDETPAVTDDELSYTLDYSKGKVVDGEFVPDSEPPATQIAFTNTYTENIITEKIPFVKKVTLGGDVAPTGETFRLEIFDIGNGGIDDYADVTCTAEVTVNGEGEFEGELVITGPESQVEQFICEGFYVREVKGSAANWTYSDAVWHIIPEWVPVEGEGVEFVPDPSLPNIGNQQGSIIGPEEKRVLSIYPTSKVIDGEFTYYEDLEQTAKKMVFENIYTENKAEEPVTPPTGDNSMMGLWTALLVISGFGVAVTTEISKKRSVR